MSNRSRCKQIKCCTHCSEKRYSAIC